MRKVAYIDECPSIMHKVSGEEVLFANVELKPTSGVNAVEVDGVSEFLLSLNFFSNASRTGQSHENT